MPTRKRGDVSVNAFISDGVTDLVINTDGSLPTSGSVSTDIEGLGDISVGTTAAIEITFSGTTKAIWFQADSDNSGKVHFGKSDVTSTGGNKVISLSAGDFFSADYDDSTSAWYVISSSASQVVTGGALK